MCWSVRVQAEDLSFYLRPRSAVHIQLIKYAAPLRGPCAILAGAVDAGGCT